MRISVVENAQLANQYAGGPPIADDVVHREHQHVLVSIKTQQAEANEIVIRQIERTLRLFRSQPLRMLQLPIGRQPTEIDDGQRLCSSRVNELHRTITDHYKIRT